MTARGAILFLARVVMATATFADANVWIDPLPAIRQLPLAARVAIMYVPYAILVGVLWAYARIGPRVQGHMAWFVVLAALAVAEIITPYAAPALMLAAALVMMQLAPRTGTLYEAASFPSIRAFVGLALLAAISLRWGADIFGLELVQPFARQLPRDLLGLVAAAIGVAAFIAFAGLRHRRVQPCGAAKWLTVGIVACILGSLASHLPANVPYGFFASAALLIAGHLALFVGAFLLLSHLLPRRDSDSVSFNP
jgi:hypothetical protein